MTGKQIFLTLIAAVIIIKHPEVVSVIINGIVQLFTNH
jgi:hypothetical protein